MSDHQRLSVVRPRAVWPLAAVLLSVALSGCIVVPAHRGYGGYGAYGGYPPPAGVAYVAPTYAVPAPGYVWGYHAQFGWGWRHPDHGWHRGWR
jgi:hypothetical protein